MSAYYNYHLEQQIGDILNDPLINEKIYALKKLFKKTKYPGVLDAIGEIYEYGFYECTNNKNIKKANKYYMKAMSQGYVHSMNRLGYQHVNKAIDSMINAREYFEEASNYDDSEGYYQLGVYYITMSLIHNPEMDFDYYFNGLEYLKLSSENGNRKAKAALKMINNDSEMVEIAHEKFKRRVQYNLRLGDNMK